MPEAIRLEQGPDDDLTYEIDFDEESDLAALLADDPIASATVILTTPTTSPALSTSVGTITGTVVPLRISGGTDGTIYRVSLKATTTGGQDAVAWLDMTVKNPARLS